MRLKSIEFGDLSNGLRVNVIRVVDKPSGAPNEPKEFVEFTILNGSSSYKYRLNEAEIMQLKKVLVIIIS